MASHDTPPPIDPHEQELVDWVDHLSAQGPNQNYPYAAAPEVPDPRDPAALIAANRISPPLFASTSRFGISATAYGMSDEGGNYSMFDRAKRREWLRARAEQDPRPDSGAPRREMTDEERRIIDVMDALASLAVDPEEPRPLGRLDDKALYGLSLALSARLFSAPRHDHAQRTGLQERLEAIRQEMSRRRSTVYDTRGSATEEVVDLPKGEISLVEEVAEEQVPDKYARFRGIKGGANQAADELGTHPTDTGSGEESLAVITDPTLVAQEIARLETSVERHRAYLQNCEVGSTNFDSTVDALNKLLSLIEEIRARGNFEQIQDDIFSGDQLKRILDGLGRL